LDYRRHDLVPRSDYADALFRYFQPVFLAELVAMLWLLIMGAKEQSVVGAVTT
jgi:hypothetical protein